MSNPPLGPEEDLGEVQEVEEGALFLSEELLDLAVPPLGPLRFPFYQKPHLLAPSHEGPPSVGL